MHVAEESKGTHSDIKFGTDGWGRRHIVYVAGYCFTFQVKRRRSRESYRDGDTTFIGWQHLVTPLWIQWKCTFLWRGTTKVHQNRVRSCPKGFLARYYYIPKGHGWPSKWDEAALVGTPEPDSEGTPKLETSTDDTTKSTLNANPPMQPGPTEHSAQLDSLSASGAKLVLSLTRSACTSQIRTRAWEQAVLPEKEPSTTNKATSHSGTSSFWKKEWYNSCSNCHNYYYNDIHVSHLMVMSLIAYMRDWHMTMTK